MAGIMILVANERCVETSRRRKMQGDKETSAKNACRTRVKQKLRGLGMQCCATENSCSFEEGEIAKKGIRWH